jgi:hypothetical protein
MDALSVNRARLFNQCALPLKVGGIVRLSHSLKRPCVLQMFLTLASYKIHPAITSSVLASCERIVLSRTVIAIITTVRKIRFIISGFLKKKKIIRSRTSCAPQHSSPLARVIHKAGR